jgi:probable FeS assembly SUF system protein SufT
MEKVETVELKRDCEAVEIPSGAAVRLRAGTKADITQRLGGTFTLHAGGALYRVAARDGDALGLAGAAGEAEEKGAGKEEAGGPVEEKLVWETLKTCYDPEIPVNIVDLGLVYDLHIEPGAGGSSRVLVKMTLTAPGCGMGATIAGDAQQKLLYLPGVEEAVVEIVWDPPWHQSMITEEGRRILGL